MLIYGCKYFKFRLIEKILLNYKFSIFHFYWSYRADNFIERVWLQSGSSPAPVRLQPGSSPAPARLQSCSSPAPVLFQAGFSPASVRLQSGFSPASIRLQSVRTKKSEILHGSAILLRIFTGNLTKTRGRRGYRRSKL